MNLYTLIYFDSEMRQNTVIFKEANDDKARDYALNTILNGQFYSGAILERGESNRFKRVCRSCGSEKQIMLVRYIFYYECLNCVKRKALKIAT